MREIIFRGKRIDNGKWVEGWLLHDSEQNESYIAEYFEAKAAYFRPIIPETVGQYTHSEDKNGNKIFEGDVVDFYFFDKGHKNTKTMLIEWRDNGFWMKELYRNYRLADDFSIISEKIFTYRGDVRHGVYTTNYTYFVEVIGNIHDNPELLKGGADNG